VENMNDAVKTEIAKLKRLVQYKNADDAVLEKAAQKVVVLRELVESGNFIDEAEKKLAKKMFEAYLDKLDFENFSDLSTLSTLVYNEVLSTRVQKSINECTSKDGKSYISDKLLKSHSDLTNQILHLKEKLGINREAEEDEFTALQLLKKRFHAWQQENKDSCTIAIPYTCSSCKHDDVKLVLLRKVVKDWTAIDHPAFLGRFYYSKHAMDMVEAGTLKKDDYAKIFQVSLDYVDWCILNRGKIVVNEKLVDKKESK
jgi:hypothetical protein